MMIKLTISFGILCAILHVSESAKILCVFPSPSKSHLLVTQAIIKELALRGNEVTVVSAFPLKNPPPNYRDVVVPLEENALKFITSMVSSSKEADGLGRTFKMFKLFPEFINTTHSIAESIFYLPEFKNIMETESFDVVIIGIFMNNFLIGLGSHFKCPIIALLVARESSQINEFMGNQANPSYTPHLMMESSGQLNFKQRVINFGISILEYALLTYADNKYVTIYDKHFPSPQHPSFSEIKKNISLSLVNYHYSQGIVRPLVPGIIEIGGIQAKSSPDPLPSDIEEWISSAKHGAIFFSMGSNVLSKDLPPNKLEGILKSFGKLKQHVLWKFEDDNLKNLPKNVKVWKWMPQDDILAHSNIKLFITHGGAGSIAEAKFHGVPIIGIPIFADQPANVAAVVEEGWCIKVEYADLSETSLSAAINEILVNSSYTTIVKTASSIYRDRPMTSQETAAFWVEYVVRHKGAKHMQSNAVHLNFRQLHSLDVIAVLLLIGLITLVVNLTILRCVFRFAVRKLLKRKPKKD